MKKIPKSLLIIIVIICTNLVMSCSKDDDGVTTIYSYTLETYTDLTRNKNTEDATNAVKLFLDEKWMTTKDFTSSSLKENDVLAKNLFKNIVEKANERFSKMIFNGNTKLTYKCTRNDENTSKEVEIAEQEWNYLKTN